MALDSNDQAQDTELSGANGSFHADQPHDRQLHRGACAGSQRNRKPWQYHRECPAGWSTSVSVGTFTVIGAMGTVTGTVKSGGSSIQTGVLVVIATGSIPSPPPTLNAAALTAQAYYADSSREDGTYSVDVRGSTSTQYNATAYYMRLSNNTPIISSASVSNIAVTAGVQTGNVNFSW